MQQLLNSEAVQHRQASVENVNMSHEESLLTAELTFGA